MMSTNYCFHFEYLSYCLFIGILLDLFTLIIELVDLSVRFIIILQVVQYWAEKGISGFTVFKYRLRRADGQPALTTNQVTYRKLFEAIFVMIFI